MNKQKCVIVVPIYKIELDNDEYNSVKQLFKVIPVEFYDIIAIHPISLDISYYKNNFNFTEYYQFYDEYFNDYPRGYNSLFLNYGFYEIFNNYEYMLVYQTDAWVFRNELEYWCNKGYDYIGAPQIYDTGLLSSPTHVGNGGFSLRKISFFINTCKKYANLINSLLDRSDKLMFGEDKLCLSLLGSNIDIKINLPSFYEAAHFSFDTNPEILYQMLDNNIPFGCHAYKKVLHNDIWKEFIHYDQKKYSVVTFLFGDYDLLREPLYVDENAEYICITDRKDLISNVWKFENITEYDISQYNDWQKTMIARYTALNHIHTDKCIILDASVQIIDNINKFIDINYGNDIGFIINPFRDSYLDELDEWINTRNLNPVQKHDFIDFCNKHNFDINTKGFIMSTIIFVNKNENTIKLMNHVLNELMNNYDFSMRVDQIYLSVIFFKYYFNLIRRYYSYQILNSKYFTYYYHNSNMTHEGDYNVNLSEVETREVYYQNIYCTYLT